MLPEFNSEGDLPAGIYTADWNEIRCRFGVATPRRVWLFGRLRALVGLAAQTGELRRVFIWGSFVTSKPAPKDVDVLLIMDEDFELDRTSPETRVVFDASRARLRFESDIFWARVSIGEEVLHMWLETYQTSRAFRKRGIVELELA